RSYATCPIPDLDQNVPSDVQIETMNNNYSLGKLCAMAPTSGHSIVFPDQDYVDLLDQKEKIHMRNALASYFHCGMVFQSSILKPDARPSTGTSTTGDTFLKFAKINTPEIFKGERSKYQSFITDLALYFSTNAVAFVSDDAKITFAVSYMRDTAKEWAVPHIKADGKTDFDSWGDFLDKFSAAFDDPDAEA